MGVFLFSTKKIDATKVVDVLNSRGHETVEIESVNNTTLVHAPKILVDNVNYLSATDLDCVDHTDYICGIGTYFYKNEYGVEALKLIYNDLESVLEKNPVYGHWAFVVHKGNTTFVFNDMSGTLRLYYQQEGDNVVISSSMVSIIASIEKPTFDKVRLGAFIASGYGNEIPFVEGIECVDPLKVLKIEDGKAPKWINRKEPEIPRLNTCEAVEHCKKLFNEQMVVIHKAIGSESVGVELTAGLDSRLIASNIKTAGFNYNFINYPLYGPDSEIAIIIAKGLGKDVHMLANESAKNDAASRYGEFDFGFDYYRQYCNNRWVIKNKFQFSGARGECIDTPDMYSDEDISYMNDPRLSILLQHLCVREELTPKYQKLYMDYLKKVYISRGFNIDTHLSEKEQVRFNQMLAGQFTGDYMYNSGVQSHLYFYQIYNEYHFNHFIMDIAFEAKCGRKLTLALIKAIDPELASYPFVSRRRTRMNSVTEVSELPMKYKSYNGIKKILPKSVVNFLYSRMGRVFDVNKLSGADLSLYDEMFDIKKFMKYPNLYSGYLNRLASVEVLRKKLNIR